MWATEARLLGLNATAFLFHLALAVLCGVLGDVDTTFPLYYPFTDLTTGVVSIKFDGEFPMTVLFVLYFSVTALFHLGNFLIWNDAYFSCLEKQHNPFRWVEYSITAPVMTSILAYLVGSRNYLFIIASATLTLSTISFGFVLDKTKSKLSFLSGLAPFVVEFGLLAGSLFLTTNCFPRYVYMTLFTEFLLWSAFPTIAICDVMGYVEYFDGESLYLVFSFLSKSVLAIVLLSKNALNDGIVRDSGGTC